MPDDTSRARLEKLLAMLGSSFDGERANAARIIATLAEREKLTIPELLFGASASRRKPERAETGHQKPDRVGRRILASLARIAVEAEEWEFTLTEWEQQFASDVSQRYENDYELSEKQLKVAERIIEKVERAYAGGGPC